MSNDVDVYDVVVDLDVDQYLDDVVCEVLYVDATVDGHDDVVDEKCQ